MGRQITATLDHDLYDKVTDESNDREVSKSKVVNERVRDGYKDNPNNGNGFTVLPAFGQSLFVAGFIVALLAFVWGGVAMAMLGLALMVGPKVDGYAEAHDVPHTTALFEVLGS